MIFFNFIKTEHGRFFLYRSILWRSVKKRFQESGRKVKEGGKSEGSFLWLGFFQKKMRMFHHRCRLTERGRAKLKMGQGLFLVMVVRC